LSPQSRRGRAVPVSHKKSPARGAATASRKPAPAIDPESDDDLLDEVDAKGKAVPLAPVRRRRGMARIQRTAWYKYTNELVGAYVPLFLIFVIALGGFWGWTTFGPHAPTPAQRFLSIQDTWLQKREDARQKVTDAMSDFKLQLAGYKEFRDDTKGWMDDLAKVSAPDWDGATPSIDPSQSYYNSQLVQLFVEAGNTEVTLLDQVVAATSPDQVLAMGTDVITDEQSFVTSYANAYTQIVGSFPKSTEAPLALPSGSLCPSPSPSPSVSPSASPSPSSSPSPSASPSHASTASPLASTSLSPSPSASPSASASVEPCASASPGSSASVSPSAS
jgi:hypothetical protein